MKTEGLLFPFTMRILVSALVILAGCRMESQQVSPGLNEHERGQMKRDVADSFVSWVQTDKLSDATRCDALVDAYLELPDLASDAYFNLAQIVYSRGHYTKAIAILNEGISKHPKERSPVSVLPMRIAGRLLTGTILRQSGKVKEAIETYENLQNSLDLENEDERLVSVICSLYLAEIASENFKNRNQCLSELEKIEHIHLSSENANRQQMLNFYQQWARYERARQSGDRASAIKTIPDYDKMSSMEWYATTHLCLTGMAPDPLQNIELIDSIQKCIYLHANNTPNGNFDRHILQLYLGFDHDRRSEYDQADHYFSILFESESFFAPLAGIRLAESKTKQLKYDQADRILEQIKTRYPGMGKPFLK